MKKYLVENIYEIRFLQALQQMCFTSDIEFKIVHVRFDAPDEVKKYQIEVSETAQGGM